MNINSSVFNVFHYIIFGNYGIYTPRVWPHSLVLLWQLQLWSQLHFGHSYCRHFPTVYTPTLDTLLWSSLAFMATVTMDSFYCWQSYFVDHTLLGSLLPTPFKMFITGNSIPTLNVKILLSPLWPTNTLILLQTVPTHNCYKYCVYIVYT